MKINFKNPGSISSSGDVNDQLSIGINRPEYFVSA